MKNISKEDYLSVIYKSSDKNGEIKANQIAEKLNISNDYFVRTTDDNHKKFVQKMLQKLILYKIFYEQIVE